MKKEYTWDELVELNLESSIKFSSTCIYEKIEEKVDKWKTSMMGFLVNNFETNS